MEPQHHPHLDHLFKVGMLYHRSVHPKMPKAVRREARKELRLYRAEGQFILDQRQEGYVAKRKKKAPEVDVTEHATRVYSGRGVIFCVADDREEMKGNTTIDVIAAAIDDALDNGHEDSESIARWITTASFTYEPDKRVRYNSLLRAGDAVGAQITRKLYNAYNELAELAADTEDAVDKKIAKAEATGFAEAISVITSPFSCEDPEDPRLVNWDMVDHITDLFEKEQVQVRRVRKGNPQ